MVTRFIPKAVSARALVVLLSAVGVVAVAASGCGSSSRTVKASTSAAKGESGQSVSMEILNGERAKKLGHLGPDGLGHDMYLPSDVAVKVGDKVTVTVTNYDEGPHTFTAPGLGVNAEIKPAVNADQGIPSKTTFTFTAAKAGKFRWYCALPCDGKQKGWAMTPGKSGPDQEKYMAGYVVAA